jgi:hypothetical protein
MLRRRAGKRRHARSQFLWLLHQPQRQPFQTQPRQLARGRNQDGGIVRRSKLVRKENWLGIQTLSTLLFGIVLHRLRGRRSAAVRKPSLQQIPPTRPFAREVGLHGLRLIVD